nr:MAG TPA: hypothetical protein [Caudoviricetes sp.]
MCISAHGWGALCCARMARVPVESPKKRGLIDDCPCDYDARC